MLVGMLIREATEQDWPAIWPFLRDIVRAAETFAYPLDLTEDDAHGVWMLSPPGRTVVAVDDAGGVLGTATMGANRPGGGSHVASASFMVDPAAAGRGVGRSLGEHVLGWAKTQGFRAIQFNAVVESNTRAVRLWKSLGFEVIGSVPQGFRRPSGEYVDLLIMFHWL